MHNGLPARITSEMLIITAYIPCHNNESTLAEVAAALRKQTRPAEQYLFINDRCTDRSPAIAREHGFTVIDLVGKYGLGAGRNLALQHCTSDVLFGVDADVVAEEDFLQRLDEAFARHPKAAAIGGRVDEKFTTNAPDLWRSIYMSQHHGDHELLNPRLLFGATMAVRTAAARRLGGWDERFITNFEDVDLCQRFRTTRMPYVYVPQCRAWHLRRDTLDSLLQGHWNWNYVGFEFTCAKMDTWLNGRMPFIWETYRKCRGDPAQRPELMQINLLLPWAWMIRDLCALRKSVGYLGDISAVAGIADEVLKRYNAGDRIRADIGEVLARLIRSLEDMSAQSPLMPIMFDAIRREAMASIPDDNYWRACRAGSAIG